MRIRLFLLFGLVLLSGGVLWLVLTRNTPQQEMSVSPLLDRGTETLQALDRLGQIATRLSIKEEQEIGAKIAASMGQNQQSYLENDPETNYLQGILDELTAKASLQRPTMTYKIQFLDYPVVNAFALPGGFLFVTRGLLELAQNEAELAAVIGHEMAHVDLGHCAAKIQYAEKARKVGGDLAKWFVQVGYQFYSIGYSDEQEEEADRQGARVCYEALYHPRAAIAIQKRMGETLEGKESGSTRKLDKELTHMVEDALGDYFSTHPPAKVRVANLEKALAEQKFDLQKALYLGKRNLQERTARPKTDYAEEWQIGPIPDPAVEP